MSFKIESPAFSHEGEIPARCTCEGDNISPELKWSGAPAGTKSFALIVDDPDAPDPAAPRMTWVHWVLYDLPAGTAGLAEKQPPSIKLPSGGTHGLNDWKRPGYGGPCPPIGTHRYFFKLYALDTSLDLASNANKKQLLQAMEGHVLAQAELMGVYSRK